GIAQCVVLGLPHPQRGEEVCAVVVPAVTDLDLDGIRQLAREQLSAYKVPTRWVIVTADQIPTLPSGKFDRKGLLANVIDGVLPISPAAP
ncbi:MAG: long-chain fatty acid--CoA ligase, partial [Mycolicibacterium frederiksbergense]|nr:long-chain fatty acid--CoA ligase [Mycolicibacterium frederiksbergense]